ncbi:MAG: glycosyltransferase family 4 protein [Bacteroidales bacterium]|nr:glycosyltransferase family 4 protein [Acholeplasmataceae bacterium]MCK9448821.1 glycosyltransferase family 4 protein [Bacteroidales bacterium]
MKKKKIAVLGAKGFPAWGGAARANEAIFTYLSGEYDITVYAISSHASLNEYQGLKQIIFKSYKSKKISTFLYYVKSMLHALFLGRYDLIHVNHLAAGFLIPFLRLRYPVILNVRGMNYKGDNKWNSLDTCFFKIFQWSGLAFSNVIITVEKGSIDKLKGKCNRKVIFIPNGVEFNENNELHSLEEEFDITFSAARIIYLKGLHLLLDALNSIRFKGKVQIIGDLDQVADYKRQIIKKSENLNCSFIGLVKSKEELFYRISKSKVFVFPSYSEGMSNMLLEAASLKVPIIASDIPQNIDIFNDDEVLFFKLPDVEDLSEKLAFSLMHEESMQEMAEKAFKHLQREYDWNLISEKYKEVYLAMLKK